MAWQRFILTNAITQELKVYPLWVVIPVFLTLSLIFRAPTLEHEGHQPSENQTLQLAARY